jgi:hypothetical protein
MKQAEDNGISGIFQTIFRGPIIERHPADIQTHAASRIVYRVLRGGPLVSGTTLGQHKTWRADRKNKLPTSDFRPPQKRGDSVVWA